jgi:hypothetical protein
LAKTIDVSQSMLTMNGIARAPEALYKLGTALLNLEVSMDEDLESRSRDQLVAEVIRLRNAIRSHRDASGHDLCWHHPHLWALLPEKVSPSLEIPAWPQFMRGCIQYRQSLDEQLPAVQRSHQEFKG